MFMVVMVIYVGCVLVLVILIGLKVVLFRVCRNGLLSGVLLMVSLEVVGFLIKVCVVIRDQVFFCVDMDCDVVVIFCVKVFWFMILFFVLMVKDKRFVVLCKLLL